MNLTTELSLWYLPVCAIVAAGLSWFLYYKNPLNVGNKYVRWALYALRFSSVFLISFLLLGILIKSNNKTVRKPVIIIAADNSQSVITNQFGSTYKASLQSKLNVLGTELNNDYEIKYYTFGNETKPDLELNFAQKQSNMEQVVSEIENTHSNKNLGAVILASDGIYNKGNNPLEAATNLKVPFYTIALGDSNQQCDALIKTVRYNQIVFAGNEFEVEIDISAFELNKKNSLVEISSNGQRLFNQNFVIDNNVFFKTIKAKLQANKEGTQHFTVNITQQKNEISYANNRYDFFVDVIKAKQKIMIVGLAPHPDLTALKQAINQNQNYQASIVLHTQITNDIFNQCDIVIAHQLPGWRNEAMPFIKQVIEKKFPCLFILSNKSSLQLLNQLQNSIKVGGNPGNSANAIASYNSNNTAIYFDETTSKQINDLPPLQVVYGNYVLGNQTQAVFKQQIGYVATDAPLLCIDNSNNLAFLMGEGFWKWRLFDFEKNNQQQITNDLISKVIQSIGVKADKSLFKVKPIKQKFDEGDAIIFDAEMYNQSYELQNSDDINLTVKNAQGKVFNYTFSKTEKAYTANLGQLPIGSYSYVARASTQKNNKTGNFIVQALQTELAQTRANYQLLNTIANETHGEAFDFNSIPNIAKQIKLNENIQSVIYKTTKLDELINDKWLFFLILVILSLEWLIRKWNGVI